MRGKKLKAILALAPSEIWAQNLQISSSMLNHLSHHLHNSPDFVLLWVWAEKRIKCSSFKAVEGCDSNGLHSRVLLLPNWFRETSLMLSMRIKFAIYYSFLQTARIMKTVNMQIFVGRCCLVRPLTFLKWSCCFKAAKPGGSLWSQFRSARVLNRELRVKLDVLLFLERKRLHNFFALTLTSISFQGMFFVSEDV